MDFITREEWNKIKSEDSVDLLNEVLTRFFNKAVETSLRSMPELISRLVKKSVIINQLNKKFFDDNPKFLDNKEIVNSTVMEIELRNPGATYEEILKLSIPEINKKLIVVKEVPKTNFDFKE